MRKCLRKCEESGEGAIMEESAETSVEVGKKRKIRLGELQSDKSSFQLKTRRLDVVGPENSASSTNSGNSACESVSCDRVVASCCSSNDSSGLAKRSLAFEDLEAAEMIPEFSTASAGESLDCRNRIVRSSNSFRRETSPSSEVQAEPGELESAVGPCESKSYRRMEKIPSEAELEEFFSVAETNLQKQFIDKYNYDIVEDQPLEGRYEWVKIQVEP